jgi:hypothetical protein
MADEKKANWVLELTVLEIVLVILVLAVLLGGAGASGGYFLATRLYEAKAVSADRSGEILQLCNAFLGHENDRAEAWRESNRSCREKVDKYETWLLNIERTTGMQATVAPPKKAGKGKGGTK